MGRICKVWSYETDWEKANQASNMLRWYDTVEHTVEQHRFFNGLNTCSNDLIASNYRKRKNHLSFYVADDSIKITKEIVGSVVKYDSSVRNWFRGQELHWDISVHDDRYNIGAMLHYPVDMV